MTGAFRGLVAKEWLRSGNLVATFAALWIALGWVVPLFDHPAWILGLGLWYALAAGHRFGGSEALDGSLEYSLALPPTRGQRWLARLAIGGLPLVAWTVAGTLAIRLDLPPRLWSALADSGFARPFAPADPLWSVLAIAVPAAVFAVSFAWASARPALAASGWWIGGLAAGGVLAAALAADRRLAGPALAVLALGALAAGWRAAIRLELPRRPAPPPPEDRWWILALAGFLVLFALLSAPGTARRPVVDLGISVAWLLSVALVALASRWVLAPRRPRPRPRGVRVACAIGALAGLAAVSIATLREPAADGIPAGRPVTIDRTAVVFVEPRVDGWLRVAAPAGVEVEARIDLETSSARYEVDWTARGKSGRLAGTVPLDDAGRGAVHLALPALGSAGRDPLDLVPDRTRPVHAFLVVGEGEPPLDEASPGGRLALLVPARRDPAGPALAWLEHTGPAVAVLAAIAVLLAQLGRRRETSAAIALAAVVLVACALDRLALERALTTAADPDARLEIRAEACLAARETFLHRRRMAEGLRRIDGPETLRALVNPFDKEVER